MSIDISNRSTYSPTKMLLQTKDNITDNNDNMKILLLITTLIIFSISLKSWYELRQADRLALRRRKLQHVLQSFHIKHGNRIHNDKIQHIVYRHDNSYRLLALENQIVKYGYGSASWLYFLAEHKQFFILELVATEVDQQRPFFVMIHPIGKQRAKQVLASYPNLYQRIFREDI